MGLDPRPDRASDSPLWDELLARASDELHGALHALRCGGGSLSQREDGSLMLQPAPDPQPHEMTSGEYQEFRERWLAPHRNELVRLLTLGMAA